MNLAEKPVPQVALEVIMKRNKEEANKLLKQAEAMLQENRRISTEMQRILPPPSTVREPPKSMPNPGSYSMVSRDTVAAPTSASMRPDPMGGLLHAADALVRSWQRRGKKNFKQLERDLMMALEKVNG